MMTMTSVRNWLGVFFLGTTALLGAYIILFQETVALPISARDATSAFQIIIPTLVGQLTLAFRWIASPKKQDGPAIDLPRWAVTGPPIAVALIMVATITLLVVDGGHSLDGGLMFRSAVTFCVTLLGSTTVFIMASVFAQSTASTQARRSRKEVSTQQ